MARPPQQPLRSEIPPEEHDEYDAVIRRMRAMWEVPEAPPEEHYDAGGYFGALLASPPLCWIASQMGTFVRMAGERDNTYSHADREFVDQVLSADWKTNVVQEYHIPDALATGVRLEAIEALRYGHEEDLNEDERLLAEYIRAAVNGTITDELWARMEERLGTRGLVEYTGFILWLQWILRMMQATKTQGGDHYPSEEEIDQIIADYRAGTRELPNYRQRLR
jgi:hypothetical protein